MQFDWGLRLRKRLFVQGSPIMGKINNPFPVHKRAGPVKVYRLLKPST